jgi:type II secretory pathway component PulM
MLILMNASARQVTVTVAAKVTVIMPVHALLILGTGVAVLVVLAYAGIVLPAVWSAKPARRKAAAAILRQILNARPGGDRR